MATDSRTLPDLPNRPGTNWIEKAGGLPGLHKRIAKHLVREQGYTEQRAYATAISQVRKVCATGRTFGGKTAVKPETKAEYCEAAAAFEALRGKNATKGAAKRAVESGSIRILPTPDEVVGPIARGARRSVEAGGVHAALDALVLAGCVGDVEDRAVEAAGAERGRGRQDRRQPRQRQPQDNNSTFNAKHKRGPGGKFARKGDGTSSNPDQATGRLQRQLERAGFKPAGGDDGVFGPNTERAVRRFQEANGLPVTGSLDSATHDRLFGKGAKATVKAEKDGEKPAASEAAAAPARRAPAAADATPSTASAGTPNRVPGVAQRGDGLTGQPSPVVRSLQSAITKLGYGVGKAGVDGRFGPDTEAAVRKFQREHSLPETGQADPATIRMVSRVQVKRASGEVKRRQEALSRSSPTRVVEAVAVPQFRDRVAALEPGETALLPDGHAIRHEHTVDGRKAWAIASPPDERRAERYFGDSHSDMDKAVSEALRRSAVSEDPASLGGSERWTTYGPLHVNGREARLSHIAPDGTPHVRYVGPGTDLGDAPPVAVGWDQMRKVTRSAV